MIEGALHASRVLQVNELRSVYLSAVYSLTLVDVYDSLMENE